MRLYDTYILEIIGVLLVYTAVGWLFFEKGEEEE